MTQLAKRLPDGTYERRGDCLMASVASILEVPLAELPVLGDEHDDGSWFTVLTDACHKHGHTVVYTENLPAYRPSGYHLACGPSPRGNGGHCVVALHGEVVHDPHPSRAGIPQIDRWLLLFPLASTPHRLPHLAREHDCPDCGALCNCRFVYECAHGCYADGAA